MGIIYGLCEMWGKFPHEFDDIPLSEILNAVDYYNKRDEEAEIRAKEEAAREKARRNGASNRTRYA